MKRRNKIISIIVSASIFCSLGLLINARKADNANKPSVSYSSHIQKIGWQNARTNGSISGTSGKALRLEAIKIGLTGDEKLSLEYRTHVQKKGWTDWQSTDNISGTTGKGLRLEAIQIRLAGEDEDKYNVYYRVHIQKIGWQNWVTNGSTAGTTGKALRLEAIQVKITNKEENNVPKNDTGLSTSREMYMEDLSKQTFNKINEYRKQNGKSVLSWSEEQFNKAQGQALLNAKNNKASHDVCQISITTNMENTAEGFVNDWINSPSHKAVLLDSENESGAVAVYKVKDCYYIVASFYNGWEYF